MKMYFMKGFYHCERTNTFKVINDCISADSKKEATKYFKSFYKGLKVSRITDLEEEERNELEIKKMKTKIYELRVG